MNSPAKFLNPPRHALDLRFHQAVGRKLNALLNSRIVDQNGNIIGKVLYADGDTVFQFQASGGAAAIKDEWDPGQSYDAQVIVFFTPDGGSAGTYYSLQKVPAGISPDTGAPNWAAFPNSPPGVWG